MINRLRRWMRKGRVPVLVLANYAEPSSGAFYGNAQAEIDLCVNPPPPWYVPPESRVDWILRRWKSTQESLHKHRRFVELLEADSELLRPFIDGEAVGPGAPGSLPLTADG